uniref:hypothetical protein n=1 Tax=Levilactobacillus brevis TaxID=1580 RepID=UPI00159518D9|nr:hypothetical protein [Levilactobacillus brevis]
MNCLPKTKKSTTKKSPNELRTQSMAFYAYLGLPAERQSRLFLNHAFDFEFSE